MEVEYLSRYLRCVGKWMPLTRPPPRPVLCYGNHDSKFVICRNLVDISIAESLVLRMRAGWTST